MKSMELRHSDESQRFVALIVGVYDVDVSHGERCLLADLHVFT